MESYELEEPEELEELESSELEEPEEPEELEELESSGIGASFIISFNSSSKKFGLFAMSCITVLCIDKNRISRNCGLCTVSTQSSIRM